jgi:hypothetical protein
MNRPDGEIVNENMDVFYIKRQFVFPDLKNIIDNNLTIIMAWIFAIMFLDIALYHGFSAKSFFEKNGMQVAANIAQNIFDFTLLLTAVCIVVATLLGEKASVNFMQVIGKIYMHAALIGFMKIGSQNSREWVSFIYMGLGMSLYVTGLVLSDYRYDLLVAQLISKQRDSNNSSIIEKIKEINLGMMLAKHKSNFAT